MDILFVTQYLGNAEELDKSNGRFIYLAKKIRKSFDVNIEIITTQFLHGKKKLSTNIPEEYEGVKITALYEPGYHRNVCLQRFRSHDVLARNVKKYLETRRKPDVVYIAVPSLAVAEVAVNYCEQNNIKSIIDVQDLWPEAFKMVVNIPPFTDMIYKPLEKQANRIYSKADEVVAVSQTYVDRVMQVNKKCKNPLVVYLGTDKAEFDKFVRNGSNEAVENIDKIRLGYCGTLGHSYDITIVMEALRRLSKEELKHLEFIVMGDGPKQQEFEKAAEGLPVIFTGRLGYGDMVSKLSTCDIAVNPIVKGAAQSIINKHMDYAMAGLPVINTQECAEYRELIEKYSCGINCKCGNVDDVVEAIRKLMLDRELGKEMGKNSRKMGEELFDRGRTYQKLVELVRNEKEVVRFSKSS